MSVASRGMDLAARVRASVPGAGRLALVIDAHVAACWPGVVTAFEAAAPQGGAPWPCLTVPRGEAAKTRVVLAGLQDDLIELRRDAVLVAVGGGATTDVAGFAAATLRRGIPWVAVPTTVLGMVDAAIGGKTGINHPAGKNLLGAFHPPAAVLTEPAFLATLDPREIRSGAAEMFKAGRLGDADLVAALAAGLPAPDAAAAWAPLLARAAAVKRTLVEKDPYDKAERRLLNYGHTVGHALETALGNDVMRHGEAVAIGMEVAMHIARVRGTVTAEDVTAQTRVLEALGLPTRVPDAATGDALRSHIALDKKRTAGAAHVMVLPEPEVGAQIVADVSTSELDAAIEACRENPPSS